MNPPPMGFGVVEVIGFFGLGKGRRNVVFVFLGLCGFSWRSRGLSSFSCSPCRLRHLHKCFVGKCAHVLPFLFVCWCAILIIHIVASKFNCSLPSSRNKAHKR